jgi:hypothetical protein
MAIISFAEDLNDHEKMKIRNVKTLKILLRK